MDRSIPQLSPVTSAKPFATWLRVLYALCIHDIKTRFFGNGLGQIVMILWPFLHIVFLIAIYTLSGRVNPYGDSLLVYSSVGVLPFIIFSYMSRWIVLSVLQNKPFLHYPIIRLLDLMVARAILEMFSIFVVTVLLISGLLLMGENCAPADWADAASAWGAAIFLALGLGILNGAITALIPMWNIVYVLLIILGYASSGVLFVTSNLPQPYRYILSWNPVLQTIEWFRSAYFIDYNSLVLDKTYTLLTAFFCLASGLLLERLTQRIRSGT